MVKDLWPIFSFYFCVRSLYLRRFNLMSRRNYWPKNRLFLQVLVKHFTKQLGLKCRFVPRLVGTRQVSVSALDLRVRWDACLAFVKRQKESGETKLVWYWYYWYESDYRVDADNYRLQKLYIYGFILYKSKGSFKKYLCNGAEVLSKPGLTQTLAKF